MFRWKREPERWWVEALAQIAPRSDKLPFLLIFWEPGETWDPVQRWEIRELDPCLDYYHPELLAAYRGAHPRTLGHWEGVGEKRRWRSNSLVSLRQWQLFQKFSCPSRRIWVVQGPNGGHPFALSQAERAFKRALGLDDADTPAPGALPYAEPDRRTFERLAAYDRLRKWGQNLTWDQRRETKTSAGLWVARDLADEYARFGKAMLNFFGEGVREAVESVPRGTLGKLYEAAPKVDQPPHDEDAIEERFVNAAPILLDKAG